MVLFISSGEIGIILLFILIFFGADKIPEFARFMAKGTREFKKATDDIKREFQESSSGVMNDIKSIGNNLTDSLTKDIAEPIKKTANETQKTFEDYHNQFNGDYYYSDQDHLYGNEYQSEIQKKTDSVESETSEEINPDDAIAEKVSESETDEMSLQT